MPKVIINDSQGLYQSSGSGVEISGVSLDITGELRGAKKEIIAASATLTLADSGAVLIPTAGSAQTFTLPAVATAAGFHVTFMAGSEQAHVIAAPTAAIEGVIFDNTNGTTLARNPVTGITSITLVNPKVGDYISIVGNGTSYYVFGWCNNTPTLA